MALGFANVVRAGSIGIVAASGTGAQQVMCLLDAAGVGVSACLGVGGRDLSSAVAGRSTKQALAALAADPATETIVVVSKPPAPEVLADIEAYAAGLGKPVHWATLGAGRPDLTASVDAILAAIGHDPVTWPSWRGDQPAAVSGSLRGLFCGGTLADEAMLVAGAELAYRSGISDRDAASEPVGIRSNIPLSPELALGPDLRDPGHVVIDFGDDSMTQGRAHPMIDPSLRLERIAVEAADPTCGVLLLDLVLGYGAHPDPAGDLVRAIGAARDTAGRALPVVVSLTGTEADPQDATACGLALAAAGADVFLSNLHGLLSADISVATAGVSLFAHALRTQAVSVTEAAWQPPMAGTEADLSVVLADARREAANAEAFARMTAAGADLVDVRPAREALGLELGTFLHAGPPIEFARASGPLKGALIGAMLLEGLADTAEEAEARRATGSPSSRATTGTPSGRWPGSSPRRCGSTSCATTCTTTRRGARSTRASARSCAMAPTAPRSSTGSSG